MPPFLKELGLRSSKALLTPSGQILELRLSSFMFMNINVPGQQWKPIFKCVSAMIETIETVIEDVCGVRRKLYNIYILLGEKQVLSCLVVKHLSGKT